MKLLALIFATLLAIATVRASDSLLEERGDPWNGGNGGGNSGGSNCQSGNFLLQSCNNQLICDNNYYSNGAYYDVVPYVPFNSPNSVPSDPQYTLRYTLTNVFGRYRSHRYSQFEVWLRSSFPNAYVTAKFFYDWDGNGSWDRTETFEISPVQQGSWNRWSQNAWNLRSVSGTGYRDFRNGKFKVVFWQPYARYGNGGYGGNQGNGQVWVLTDKPTAGGYYSDVSLPYDNLSYNGQICNNNYPYPYDAKKQGDDHGQHSNHH